MGKVFVPSTEPENRLRLHKNFYINLMQLSYGHPTQNSSDWVRISYVLV